MPDKTQQNDLDKDQQIILAVYSFYTNESDHTYLQYTAACAVIYYLTQEGFFKYNKNELLVYDYKESRRYIWEAKKFMADINILRDHNYLIRARSRSKTYRDVNAHQCSKSGHEYLNNKQNESPKFKEKMEEIKKVVSCSNGHLFEVHLDNDGPKLVCKERAPDCVKVVQVKGFLRDLDNNEKGVMTSKEQSTNKQYEPFFI